MLNKKEKSQLFILNNNGMEKDKLMQELLYRETKDVLQSSLLAIYDILKEKIFIKQRELIKKEFYFPLCRKKQEKT